MRFWDSSALIALVKNEPCTTHVLPMHEQDSDLIVWWGTPVECTSGLMRRVREGSVDPPELIIIQHRLRGLFDGAAEIAPSSEVRARAERLLAVHPLRAADALQLGAALIWAREHPIGIGFVSLDDRLRDAASKEGFSVLP